ncbi:hypothetical protein M3Y98_00397700 [Aphelenchoides besseyi]|nr:hypothetical protein M3Y98_00397700 [Aphelenchoides besseyi]KAI6202420.1 hypothetical protein M3Y96_00946600 [Aphelenchoides besseyi]
MAAPYLLSCSAIFALVGLALVGIAGFTDNWSEFTVNRQALYTNVKKTADLNDQIYFSRSYGLYLVCFPNEVPSGSNSFSKFSSHCAWNKDFFPDEKTYDRYNAVQKQRVYFLRSLVGSYFAGFVLGVLALVTGAIGCFKPSSRMTLCTGFIFMFASILLAVSMGLWHYNQYVERRVLDVYPFYRSWETVLIKNTNFTYGYSYILAWVGIGFTILTSVCLILAFFTIKYRKEGLYESKHAAFYQQYYNKSVVPYSGGNYGGYEIYPTNHSFYGQHYPPAMSNPHYYGHYMSYGH